MAKWNVEVEVDWSGNKQEVEDRLLWVLGQYEFAPENVRVQIKPEPLRLADYNARMVRRPEGDETYRIVIPGLAKNGQEVALPVYEEDVDLELLAHILEHEGTWE